MFFSIGKNEVKGRDEGFFADWLCNIYLNFGKGGRFFFWMSEDFRFCEFKNLS